MTGAPQGLAATPADPLTIDHLVAHADWQPHIARAVEVLEIAVVALALPPVEISVVWQNDAGVAALNGQYRGKYQPTNVLSFPAADLTPDAALSASVHPHMLGDIVMAYETVAREAEAARLTLPDHMAHLLVHGLLHLLGHTHDADAPAALMEAREGAILEACGIADPYQGRDSNE